MSTAKAVRSSTVLPASSLVKRAAMQVRDALKRLATRDASAEGAGDLWQLYRMTRGSDSIRPVVVRKLAALARRQPA